MRHVRRLSGKLCRKHDIFLRAETQETLLTMLKSKPFCDIIGNLVDEKDNLYHLRKTKGEVDHKYFPSGTVVSVPETPDTSATMDRWAWLHLYLTGFTADADFRDNPTDKDKDIWNKSNIRKWMEDNGKLRTIRGTKVYEHTLDSGKRLQMWRLRRGIVLNGIEFPKEKGPN